ncbi:fimbrial protein [Aeromonas jandaei]|uniref:fimbrial protein n=1 Tax=Aeromonas jandaei TaxID=650 RepID=UPI002AA0C0C4|nr:fimbrial protein [Aeromonas jandaei]
MTLKELLSVSTALLTLGALTPTMVYAECHVVEPPVMQYSYDYQRDRSVGSSIPIATVNFETVLECEQSPGDSHLDLIIDNGGGWQSKVTPYHGQVMMRPELRDSVGIVWNNRIASDEARVEFSSGKPFSRRIGSHSGRIRVSDSFDFYYIAAGISPGMDISPGTISVNYGNGSHVTNLYELNFPAIPLHALSCSVDSDNIDISFGKVNELEIGNVDDKPLDSVVKRVDWNIQCDPGTNVGLRINTAKSFLNNVVIPQEILEGNADGIGIKMRYLSMARSIQDIQFGQTMPWGKIPDSKHRAKQSVLIPLEFYLVKTKSNTQPGKLQASATIELRHE